jgi:HEPN domain-containing protein
MANRFSDWLRQADADLRHAVNANDNGDHEWSCFAAQQAAEKALKALYYRLGKEAWGHTVSALLGSLPGDIVDTDDNLTDCAKLLDKHYILTRYPNGFDSGAPTDFYTKKEGNASIACAKEIIEYCRDKIDQS